LAANNYIGRFAPSPTGPLHFGSLVTALAGYEEARRNNGKWLVRIEDLDGPRCVSGADVEILRTLEHYGLEWDGPVLYQSTRHEAYEAALEELRRKGVAYAVPNSLGAVAWKAQDFTLRRSDGPYAYHLAVVVDDATQGVTHIVRGADLLDSTPRQLWLQTQLNLPHPAYRHVPVVLNELGQKLSKQTGAPGLRLEDREKNLEAARRFLQSAVLTPP
jgi:glutamyl-Q tRNA(Asp) synthetase